MDEVTDLPLQDDQAGDADSSDEETMSYSMHPGMDTLWQTLFPCQSHHEE
jgi:hypothetical protein